MILVKCYMLRSLHLKGNYYNNRKCHMFAFTCKVKLFMYVRGMNCSKSIFLSILKGEFCDIINSLRNV